ncbi:MAG: MoaD/ThiS family protein [Anaerolineae bacterium]
MITVQVRLFATLRRYYPDLGIGEAMPIELPEGATVKDLLEELDLPGEQVMVVFVSGVTRDRDHPLKDGDEVGIFPPVGGG